MRRLAVATVVVVLLAVGGAAFFGVRTYQAPGPLEQDRAVTVPHGGLGAVADVLQREGVVRHRWQLEAAALLTRGQGSVHSAELEFPAGGSLEQVLAVLRTAKPVQHKLTIAEGLTSAQVSALLGAATALDGPVPAVPEGSIMPETYAYERGTTRAALLGRAERAMAHAVEAAWATRAPDLPLSSPAEAVILASIVERETAKPEERPMVAAVYLNRLRRGLKLQSDPTVVYGVSGGAGALDHGLTRSELDRDTPYNTYLYPGLPPGPICMPGAASLAAATHPAETDTLFFVADGGGGHVFARTEGEHARNVARWRELERQRPRRLP